MRQYLAMYFDPNKPGMRDPLNRAPGYSLHGMYPHEPPPSGKVGEFNVAHPGTWHMAHPQYHPLVLTPSISNQSLHLPVSDNWHLAPHRTEFNGFGHLLFPR